MAIDINGTKIIAGDLVRIIGSGTLTHKHFYLTEVMKKMMNSKISYTVDYSHTKTKDNYIHLAEGYLWHGQDAQIVVKAKESKPNNFQFDENLIDIVEAWPNGKAQDR